MKPDGSVEVCLVLDFPAVISMIENQISFALQIISLICLSLTFMTYSIFPELRNLPGVNLMSLTFATLTAQVTG